MRSSTVIKNDLNQVRASRHRLAAETIESAERLKLFEAQFVRKEIELPKLTEKRVQHTALVDTLNSLQEQERTLDTDLETTLEREKADEAVFDQIRESAAEGNVDTTLEQRFDNGNSELAQRFGKSFRRQ